MYLLTLFFFKCWKKPFQRFSWSRPISYLSSSLDSLTTSVPSGYHWLLVISVVPEGPRLVVSPLVESGESNHMIPLGLHCVGGIHLASLSVATDPTPTRQLILVHPTETRIRVVEIMWPESCLSLKAFRTPCSSSRHHQVVVAPLRLLNNRENEWQAEAARGYILRV